MALATGQKNRRVGQNTESKNKSKHIQPPGHQQRGPKIHNEKE
jgi:hypothetical protein